MDIYVILLMILVAVLSYFLTRNNNLNKSIKKGMEGEKKVKNVLKKLPREYIILNDIFIKNKTNTSQIDHIVISHKGIFVIETKNYSGKIFGDDYSKYWVQKLNGRRNTFYSPIWQNRTHVNAVRYMLKGYRHVPVYSIVVFCGDCNIRKVKSKGTVISIKKLNRHIKKFNNNIFLEESEIEDISKLLHNSNIHSKKIRKEHVKIIKKEYI